MARHLPAGPLLTLALAALAAAPTPAAAAPHHRCDVELAWDARTGVVTVREDGATTTLPAGRRVVERRVTGRVCVEVTGITTAVQRVTSREADVDAANLAAAGSFLAMASPLLMDQLGGSTKALDGVSKRMGEVLAGLPGRGVRDEAAPAVVRAVQAVRRLVEGPAGLIELRREATVAIGQMAVLPERSEPLAGALGRRLGAAVTCRGGAAGCEAQLAALPETVDAYAGLAQALADARAGGPPLAEEAQAEAEALLDGLAEVLRAARDTEQLLSAALSARASVRLDPVEISWYHGAALELRVEPRGEPALSFAAPRWEAAVALRLLPASTARLTLAPVLLGAPDAMVPLYGRKSGTIQVTGTFDGRYVPGLALAVVPRALDWRETGGPAISVPTFTLVPFADYGAGVQFGAGAGVGASVIWRRVTFGLSAYWYRYQALSGVKVGDPIAAGEAIPLKAVYSSATLAWTLGVTLD